VSSKRSATKKPLAVASVRNGSPRRKPSRQDEDSRSTVQCNTRIAREAKVEYERELLRRQKACKSPKDRAKITLGAIVREQLERAPWCFGADGRNVRQQAVHASCDCGKDASLVAKQESGSWRFFCDECASAAMDVIKTQPLPSARDMLVLFDSLDALSSMLDSLESETRHEEDPEPAEPELSSGIAERHRERAENMRKLRATIGKISSSAKVDPVGDLLGSVGPAIAAPRKDKKS
jgi:hypothetical protein